MVLISVVCLFYALRGIEPGKLWEEIREMDWRWVTVAMVTDILVYVIHGYRWSTLLRPLANTSPWQCIRAIYVGLYANEILPFRTGELIRCYLQTRWTGLPFSVTLTSALIERIFDGVWLVLFLAIVTRYVALPPFLRDMAWFLVILLIIAIGLLGFTMFHKQKDSPFMRRKSMAKIRVLLDDLYQIGHSRYLYTSALLSLPYLLMQILPIYATMKAYPSFDESFWMAAVVMVIARLGSVVPQAPGNVGGFNIMVINALSLFAVQAGTAKRFALILWGIVTLPLLIAGFIALAITGLKIRELQREAQTAHQTKAESGAV